MQEEIRKIMLESIGTTAEFMNEGNNLERASKEIIGCFRRGGKVLIFGNGGSAADSQHIAGEMVGRFKSERKAFPVIALTNDSSVITAVANDYDYSKIFERQVEALARKGDILIGITTSGNSENVVKGLKKGKEIGTFNISMTGNEGGSTKQFSDVNINSKSKNIARIQECHKLAYHIICELVENEMIKPRAELGTGGGGDSGRIERNMDRINYEQRQATRQPQ